MFVLAGSAGGPGNGAARRERDIPARHHSCPAPCCWCCGGISWPGPGGIAAVADERASGGPGTWTDTRVIRWPRRRLPPSGRAGRWGGRRAWLPRTGVLATAYTYPEHYIL